jgi:hypothetical protein
MACGLGEATQQEIRLADVEAVATNAGAWILGTGGPRVTFAPWRVATAYAFGETEVVVPGADLRDYLLVDASIPRASYY